MEIQYCDQDDTNINGLSKTHEPETKAKNNFPESEKIS